MHKIRKGLIVADEEVAEILMEEMDSFNFWYFFQNEWSVADGLNYLK